MGRNHRRNKQENRLDCYWQSADYNSSLFFMYRNQLKELALSRFKWINLPRTCDQRYLELTLITQGIATIAFPKKQKGTFYSTQVAQMSPPNVYDNPSKWLSIGNNGWRFKCSPENGVVVFDNLTRYPLMQTIDMYARELVDIRRTKQINRMMQKKPFIIKCDPKMENQALNIYKQIAGNEPAIIATNGMEQIDMEVLPVEVPYLGEQLSTEEMNTWQLAYQALGIENLNYKAERMVQAEVNKRDEPTDLIALNSLKCRREAARKLNERFGEYLDGPIGVVWDGDNISENYDLLHNIKKRIEVAKGGNVDDS